MMPLTMDHAAKVFDAELQGYALYIAVDNAFSLTITNTGLENLNIAES